MSDTIAQSYAIVDPDGQVRFDFDGHVRAHGLDLDAGVTDTPPSENRVRWLRTTDDLPIADVYGAEYDTGPTVGTARQAALRSATGAKEARINAQSFVGDGTAGAIASQVVASADGKGATVLRGDGASGFVQLAAVGVRKLSGLRTSPTIALAAGGESTWAIAHGFGTNNLSALSVYVVDTNAAGAGHWCSVAVRGVDVTNIYGAVRNHSGIAVAVQVWAFALVNQ